MNEAKPPRGDLTSALPTSAEEVFETLVEHRGTKIERIVSRGQASPSDFWYDQPTDEWVMVVAGRAGLEIEGEEDIVELGPGQWIDLPAHTRHRVAWTSDDPPTVWLAVHVVHESA